MTSNRFALWALAASLWVVMDIGIIVQSQNIGQQLSEALAAVYTLETGVDILVVCLLGLGFFPMKFYQRWVQGQHSAELPEST